MGVDVGVDMGDAITPAIVFSVAMTDLDPDLRLCCTVRLQLAPAAFDEQLEYLLSSALSTYEMERVTSLHIPNHDFQLAMKRIVKRGHTFKVRG